MKSFRHVRFSATQGWTLDKKKHPQDWYEVCFKWTEIELVRYGKFSGAGVAWTIEVRDSAWCSGVQKPGRDAVSASAGFRCLQRYCSKMFIKDPLKVAIGGGYWYEYTKAELNRRSEFSISLQKYLLRPLRAEIADPKRLDVWYF